MKLLPDYLDLNMEAFTKEKYLEDALKFFRGTLSAVAAVRWNMVDVNSLTEGIGAYINEVRIMANYVTNEVFDLGIRKTKLGFDEYIHVKFPLDLLCEEIQKDCLRKALTLDSDMDFPGFGHLTSRDNNRLRGMDDAVDEKATYLGVSHDK